MKRRTAVFCSITVQPTTTYVHVTEEPSSSLQSKYSPREKIYNSDGHAKSLRVSSLGATF